MMSVDNPLPVADLSVIHPMLDEIVSPKAPGDDGPEERKAPQTNHLQPRQFSREPDNGPEGSTGEPVGLAAGSDAMTMGSGDAGVP